MDKKCFACGRKLRLKGPRYFADCGEIINITIYPSHEAAKVAYDETCKACA